MATCRLVLNMSLLVRLAPRGQPGLLVGRIVIQVPAALSSRNATCSEDPFHAVQHPFNVSRRRSRWIHAVDLSRRHRRKAGDRILPEPQLVCPDLAQHPIKEVPAVERVALDPFGMASQEHLSENPRRMQDCPTHRLGQPPFAEASARPCPTREATPTDPDAPARTAQVYVIPVHLAQSNHPKLCVVRLPPYWRTKLESRPLHSVSCTHVSAIAMDLGPSLRDSRRFLCQTTVSRARGTSWPVKA